MLRQILSISTFLTLGYAQWSFGKVASQAPDPPDNFVNAAEVAKMEKIYDEILDVEKDSDLSIFEYICIVACRSYVTRVYVLGMQKGDHRGRNSKTGIIHDGRLSISKIAELKPGLHKFGTSGQLVSAISSKVLTGIKENVPKRRLSRLVVLGGGSQITEPMLREVSSALAIDLKTTDAISTHLVEETRTLTGEEEAYYDLLAANYLTLSLDPHSMLFESEKAAAVIDLGYEFFRVAVPPNGESLFYDANGIVSDNRRRLHQDVKRATDVKVRSFEGFGISEAYKNVKAVDKDGVCEFDPVSGSGEECFNLVTQTLFKPSPFRDILLPPDVSVVALGEIPKITSFAKFFIQFKMDVNDHYVATEWPTSAWGNIREAAMTMCNAREIYKVNITSDYVATGHPDTSKEELPLRCFGVAYVAALMEALGLERTSRQVNFNFMVDNHRVDWTLGYFISDFKARDVAGLQAKAKARRLARMEDL